MNRRLGPLAIALMLFAPLVVQAAPTPKTADKNGKPASQPTKPRPKWAIVVRTANETLRDRPDYEPGDLIFQSEVQKLFGRLATLGWEPADAAEILGDVPADDEYIVKHLLGKNNKDGKRFMRHVAQYPLGYDRLDRMVRLPRGQVFTDDLIRHPSGWQMIEYMSTAQGGIEMGKMLSEIPDGRDFNKPTGRIYTVEQLLARLKLSYDKKP